MRVFVTGATGFLGGRLARLLRHRGDEVVALVRSPSRAAVLAGLGCELVIGDLDGIPAGSLDGCDLVVHAAAVYKVGVAAAEVAPMREANVAGTERVIDAAVRAGVPRILYVSTVNVCGDTRRAIVDESHARDLSSGFLSAYDETKYRAHQLAEERAAGGAPVVIAMPGGIYGPGDTSQLGAQIRAAMAGKLRYVSFPTLGLNAGYVDDIAAGLLLIAEQGTLGESYVIGGEITTMRALIGAAAAAAGRKPPRLGPFARARNGRPRRRRRLTEPPPSLPPGFGRALSTEEESGRRTQVTTRHHSRETIGATPRGRRPTDEPLTWLTAAHWIRGAGARVVLLLRRRFS